MQCDDNNNYDNPCRGECAKGFCQICWPSSDNLKKESDSKELKIVHNLDGDFPFGPNERTTF